MIRRIMLIKMKDGISEEQAAHFEGRVRETPERMPFLTVCSFGRNVYESNMPDGLPGPWTYVWDTAVDGMDGVASYREHSYLIDVLAPLFVPQHPGSLVQHVTFVYFEPQIFHCENRETRPRKQQLIYQFREDITPEQIERFDSMMLEMPKNIPQMRNFCLGTAILRSGLNPWHRVWEWEFMTDEDFGYYIDHEAHMDVVPFFSQESADCLVRRGTNAQYQLDESLMRY